MKITTYQLESNPDIGFSINYEKDKKEVSWQPSEEPQVGYSGGYYLSDGEPIKDHPYSGAFCFHLRGMSYFVRPKQGMLMMWPNDIVHSVKPFYGKKHRCVINFNIQL